ncbi:MAG: Transcriptional regulator [Candidatus Gottesmanbacteria bacterium GW2011_GWA1_34_13]|uniref:Transcriptional regulator n=1 Tax=Candidatus Gottesmanbacteria bacterium GW2011_GWA1_34_13 TaxID=1618434 RepID=A0A0G0DUA3_9BACT|nr:MAG: Transcriptional regulator [Candidatus Gottesmanbacteria bacterium GW2011_GWA1_34_13]
MLKDLITSRVRVKLLTLLLSNPDKIFHVREIVRQIKEEINAVRRELKHLEDKGYVSKEPRANRLYYTFRKNHPIYFELLELIAKTSGLGGDILKYKAKLGKIKFAMLSGKFVRRLAHNPSDVDLLLVGTVVLPELGQLVRQEETYRGREINYTVMTEEEFIFRKKRKDQFISEILLGARVMILGDEEELAA